MIRLIFTMTALLSLASLGACNSTDSQSVKTRQAANDRMNLVQAQIHRDQSYQAFQTGQFDKALREINHAIDRFPKMPDYYVLQGRIFMETHKLEQALRSFQTAIEKADTLQDEIARGADKHAKGSDSTNTVSSAARQDNRTATELAKTTAQAHYFAGIVFQRWSDDEQAYQHYRQAFELESTNAQYLLASAESLVALGEFESAKQLIESKLTYFEHNAALRQLQAQIALLQGEPKKAAALYGEARLLSPDDDMLLEQLMWAQYAAEMYGQCHESVKRLQERAKNTRPELFHLEARCLAQMNRGVEARDLYLQLTRMQPADATIWSELGTLAWDLGDYRRVALCSAQLIALAPDRYEGYMLKGINERYKGNLDEAIELFRKACALGSDVALPHLLLGKALEQSGDLSGAKLAYQSASQVEPNSPEARELLSRLLSTERMTAAPSD
jgi:Flp pilus assembly protein TadD